MGELAWTTALSSPTVTETGCSVVDSLAVRAVIPVRPLWPIGRHPIMGNEEDARQGQAMLDTEQDTEKDVRGNS